MNRAGPIRPFYWSVRRELWEHRSLYIAPLAVAGLILFAFFVSSFWLAAPFKAEAAVRAMSTADVEAFARASKAAARAKDADVPYNAVAGLTYLTALLVAGFYASGALYSERRDRTILFWKSLPVSDVTTVLAKLFVTLAVAPAVVFGVVVASHLAMLAWSSLVLAVQGIAPIQLYRHLHFPFLWVALFRGLIIVALWYAPVVAWLMLVSGWAKRVPFLWALAPWLAVCAVEGLATQTHRAFDFLVWRIGGGYMLAFTVDNDPQEPIHAWAHLIPTAALSTPGLWGGLIVAAGLLAAAVRLRRYRDPI